MISAVAPPSTPDAGALGRSGVPVEQIQEHLRLLAVRQGPPLRDEIDRQVAYHGELDRKPPQNSLLRGHVGLAGRNQGVDQNVRNEDRAARPGQHRRPQGGHRGRKKEKHSIRAEEVAIPQWSSAAGPRMGQEKQQDRGHAAGGPEDEDVPGGQGTSPPQHAPDGHHRRKEERHESRVPPHEEVAGRCATAPATIQADPAARRTSPRCSSSGFRPGRKPCRARRENHPPRRRTSACRRPCSSIHRS